MSHHKKSQITKIKQLGKGAFGTVYLTKDESNAQYALKTIQLDPFAEGDQQNEINIMKSLDHPNIIKPLMGWSCEEKLNILMEFCPGKEIRQCIINAQQNLKAEQKLSILHQVVKANLEMNLQGIIHRDIKPQNILLESNNTVKIIDFGCSKKINPQQIYNQVNESFDKGTTIYASPEELRSQSYSAKCDVWSIGCVAYQLEHQQHPLAFQTAELLNRVKESSIEEQIKVSNTTDRRLQQFINLTLKDKEEERASWQELLLSRVFSQPVANREKFITYLHELVAISKWINGYLHSIRNELKKRLLKLFLYFMTKFQKSALEMELSILQHKPEYQYLFSNDEQPSKDADLLRNLKFELARVQEAYNNMQANMNGKDYFQEVKKQFPKKRVSCFADLEFTTRYGRLLLKEAITEPREKDEWEIWIAITKWVKFEKFMIFEEQPTLAKVSKGTANPYSWIKEQILITLNQHRL